MTIAPPRLRAVFMGSPEFALPSLLATHARTDVQLVVTQPDRPAGRGRALTPPPVKLEAERLGLPVVQPLKLRDGSFAEQLRAIAPAVVIVVAFGRILPQEVLDVPPLGCINVHGSLLPRWRGAAPIQRAVLAGDPTTGVAIMRMEAGLDTGPVFHMVEVAIDPRETAGALFERLAPIGADALAQVLDDLPELTRFGQPRPQDHARATLAPPLRKDEGDVAWELPARTIVDHVRGMDPWPGASSLRGMDRLKLHGATVADVGASGHAPGSLLGLGDEGLLVATGHAGAVAIAEVQPPGKRRMSARDYLRGRPLVAGERLMGAPVPSA
jgi:methionyl-tRNA formyltransferase